MPTLLSLDEHGDGIGDAWTVIREHANRAGLDAAVPTCAGWRVRDLVAHQGTVHRWAAATLRGREVDTVSVEQAGRAAVDQLGWLDEGARDLLQALADAPDDLDVSFFLLDAPPPRRAWARRQCHETTIHGVDAMSASLGRAPLAAETWIGPRLAADGLDELLCGFVPRPRQRLRSADPLRVLVETTDTGHAWTLEIGTDPVVTTPDRVGEPDAVLTGTAAQLYLGLWNRGDELTTTGRDVRDQWREQMRVVWG
jgi:uncharacterized protein (TIGR03083 family)